MTTFLIRAEVIYKQACIMLLFTPCMERCGHTNCLCIPIDREESNEGRLKKSPWRSHMPGFLNHFCADVCVCVRPPPEAMNN